MGATSSKPDKLIEELPGEERYFGLENFGNTCYCNSVLQALYFCAPFRERVLAHAAALQAAAAAAGRGAKPPPENVLTCLAELFTQVGAAVGPPSVRPRGRRRGPPCLPAWLPCVAVVHAIAAALSAALQRTCYTPAASHPHPHHAMCRSAASASGWDRWRRGGWCAASRPSATSSVATCTRWEEEARVAEMRGASCVARFFFRGI